MKSTNFNLVRYDADDGYVFDWKEPRYTEEVDERGNVINSIQEHLYAKTLFIGGNDSIDNYIEIVLPIMEEGNKNADI
jgi:hypothetical protein